jgi:hypothetical protein
MIKVQLALLPPCQQTAYASVYQRGRCVHSFPPRQLLIKALGAVLGLFRRRTLSHRRVSGHTDLDLLTGAFYVHISTPLFEPNAVRCD